MYTFVKGIVKIITTVFYTIVNNIMQ